MLDTLFNTSTATIYAMISTGAHIDALIIIIHIIFMLTRASSGGRAAAAQIFLHSRTTVGSATIIIGRSPDIWYKTITCDIACGGACVGGVCGSARDWTLLIDRINEAIQIQNLRESDSVNRSIYNSR